MNLRYYSAMKLMIRPWESLFTLALILILLG